MWVIVTLEVSLLIRMPLTRPKNKNSSRSPGISSATYFQSASTPKGFQPPSYYAAAAGITYTNEVDKSSEEQTRRANLTGGSVPDYGDSFVLAPMPTAQLPVSSSTSSTEPTLVSRMSFLNRKLSRSNGISSKSSSKRKSQLVDLPLVEAQLVPSLRDTIDRMTNSPSSQTHSPAVGLHASPQHNPHDALPFLSPKPIRTLPHHLLVNDHKRTDSAHTTNVYSEVSKCAESSRIPTPVATAKPKLN
ncbi:hypothetical protein B0F90DRAFT_393896 [Multifurca ochricompacta]|uniref:Uncharacterized protein n=1 Tax=Multifurca ochricompacta TaxID=376703 RepID=A0AAD4M5U7_9AGAM|nr:hypothetical protein B0F90DRAFT_393896 [Multifurca ochricompacta]